MPTRPRTPPLDPNDYETDEDGLPRATVGPWVEDKHARLLKYVGISRSVRKKFISRAEATFIDLFCGPGRARIEKTQEVVPGSPLVAWQESVRGKTPFTQVHIADAHPALVGAAETRLRKESAPVFAETGTAEETVGRIVGKLDRYALHVAFLDPFNLEDLPFVVIKALAGLHRMDILIHVSAQDLQRNLHRYLKPDDPTLDIFAPGWKSLIRAEGMTTAESLELVAGSGNQRLYWLAFAARHEQALQFWEKIRDAGTQRELKF